MIEQNVSSSPNRSTVLKVLSGPQQGAEARLTDGTTYLIGSTDECDIVLQAESVAPKHLTLTVARERIHLDVQEQPVVVGDRKLPPGQIADFPTGAVIRLGRVYIGVGPENADWSQAVLPDTGKASEGTVDRGATGETEPGASQPSPPLPAPEKPPVPAAKPRSSVKGWWAFGGIGFAALALVAGWKPFNDWLNMGTAVDRAASEPSVVAKTQAIIAELGLPDISITARPDGGVILTGYCESREVKNRLTTALRAQGVQADNQLWPEEVLQEAVAHTLEHLGGKALSYNYLGKGVLHLRGLLRTDLHHDQLLSILRNDVPGVNRIESNAKTLADFVKGLQEQVRQAGLGEQITIAAEGAGITATGLLDAEQMQRWNAIVQPFVVETQDFLMLDQRMEQNAQPSPVAAKKVEKNKDFHPPLNIAVRGIMIGPDQVPHALLNNGARIAEGDRIEDHYIVEKILFNRVIVRDGSQTRVYYIGESAHE